MRNRDKESFRKRFCSGVKGPKSLCRNKTARSIHNLLVIFKDWCAKISEQPLINHCNFTISRPFHDAASCHDWLHRQSRSQDPAFMAVVEANSGDALGVAAWLNIVPEHGSIEVGHLNFSSRLSRSSAATEALFLMVARVFALGYRRLEWKCDALNAPSRQAAQRLGFQSEGIFRRHRVVRGHNRDTAWYSLLDSEWERLRPLFLRWLAPSNFDAQGRQRTSLSSLTGTA